MTNDTEKDTAENFDTNAEAAAEQKVADQQAAAPNGHINGSAAPATAKSIAAAIMSNPAAASVAATVATPMVIVLRTLEILPGLVGALDSAIKDQTGKHQPFVLLIFAEGTALHSANFAPEVAKNAVIELAKRWDEGEPSPVVAPGDEIPSSIKAVEAAEGADPSVAANDENPSGVTH